MNDQDDMSPERLRMIQELRERYLQGTLDEVLIPEDADFSGLLEDLAAEPVEKAAPKVLPGRQKRVKTA
ncbi:MAG: hypothetical protein KC656_17750 [Myxococcales bacterium]|nr:hypothetical protein [Myxococcales bacterium]